LHTLLFHACWDIEILLTLKSQVMVTINRKGLIL
jgi:hypothetical protein